MTYDGAHGVSVLFGGSALLDQFDDTWVFSGRSWSRLQPAHHPSARTGQGMAFDAARGQVILYGGTHGLGERGSGLSDTWAWDGRDWTQLSDDGPPRRNEFAMAFDPTLKAVIQFGGRSGNTSYRNDTWAWDGGRWSPVSTADQPSPRGGPGLAFDPHLDGLILFGGAELKPGGPIGGAGLPTADTWARSATGWTRLAPTMSPPARDAAVLVEDPAAGGVLLFGGTTCPFTDQTWAWDGSTWRQLHPKSAPPPRLSSTAAADRGRKQVILFGGLADSPCL
ncbi:MAG: hypothetical protein NVS9B1_00960 [Candidatus Dormibacteraceae bacterium]